MATASAASPFNGIVPGSWYYFCKRPGLGWRKLWVAAVAVSGATLLFLLWFLARFVSVFGTLGHHFGGLGAAGEAFGHPGGLKWGTWVAKVTFSSIFDGFWGQSWVPGR